MSVLRANPKLTHKALSGLCSAKERYATKNADTLGFVTQNTGVIRRANGVPLGVQATGGRDVDLGDQTRPAGLSLRPLNGVKMALGSATHCENAGAGNKVKPIGRARCSFIEIDHPFRVQWAEQSNGTRITLLFHLFRMRMSKYTFLSTFTLWVAVSPTICITSSSPFAVG